MVTSEKHAGERINDPSSCCIFGLSITCSSNINYNPSKNVGKTRSRTQYIGITFLPLAILFLFSIIDGVESLDHSCQHSKNQKQKTGCNMTPQAAAFSVKNETESTVAVSQGQEKNDWNLCLTSGCVTSANSVLQNMDRGVDPCDNFYEFACGKFLKEVRIPDDQTGVTVFGIINDKLNEQLRDILDQPILPNEIKPFVYAKNLFNSCMNKAVIEEKGAKPMLSILKELGGWPVLEGSNWKEADWDWKKSVYSNRKKGLPTNYFINCHVSTDIKNSSARVIVVDEAVLSLGKEFLTNISKMDFHGNKMLAAYYDYMVDIAVLMGADESYAKTELESSLQLEMKIFGIFVPSSERRDIDKLYNPMTLPELQKKIPSIPWKEYLRNMLPEKIKLKPDEKIIVYAPSYVEKLEKLLSGTPKRTQANYALWRVVSGSVKFLSDKFRRSQLEYASIVTGKTEMGSRWKECIKVAGDSFPLAVGAQYVRKFFKEDSKQNAVELVCRIRKEMYKIIEHVDWMDEQTRAAALEKAKAMTTHIAYPDELLDDKKLIEFYEKLEISSTDDYIGAVLNVAKFRGDRSLGRLRDPVNKTDWISHGRPAIVNAFYNSLENSIQFPAGILQGAFFNKDRPHYMNYGAIGLVIGHEITHGFDDKGRQFNKDGNLVEWWDEDTKKKYLEKVKCIIDQYSNYTVRQVNMTVRGVNTQGENIADNGGIKEAYYAYKSWEKQFGAEPRLPGLQMYSPHQMFWISTANVWCSKFKDETLKSRIASDVHSPTEFRVIGPFSNLKEFSQDFGCPTGSKMNPQHKCSVW
ncbi:hypothetical protein LSTR_LSTR012069 [Laodelphax striatellus]|uniref:Uncharacterized protein n=1 Tax=Laodelphax striatellus TaxID=195883 RepID=A0A482WRG2_LAOST|nr:hypothetical protein LSTR_LSTR012069 [Laodelphax striatellus]